MSERIDHAAEAAEYVEAAADEYTREGGPIRVNVADWLTFAKVHAQLALVEQQRIANLIALFHHDPENLTGGAASDFSNEAWGHLAGGNIRAALGLTAEQEGENDG